MCWLVDFFVLFDCIFLACISFYRCFSPFHILCTEMEGIKPCIDEVGDISVGTGHGCLLEKKKMSSRNIKNTIFQCTLFAHALLSKYLLKLSSTLPAGPIYELL